MAEKDYTETFDSWPVEQQKLDVATWLGLIDGDLGPLVEYLRSDYPMHRTLREDLARCIEGKDTLHKIICKKQRSGVGGVRKSMTTEGRMIEICEFVAARIPDSGKVENAIEDACKHFDVSRATVTAARRWGREVKEGKGARLAFSLGGWKRQKSTD